MIFQDRATRVAERIDGASGGREVGDSAVPWDEGSGVTGRIVEVSCVCGVVGMWVYVVWGVRPGRGGRRAGWQGGRAMRRWWSVRGGGVADGIRIHAGVWLL